MGESKESRMRVVNREIRHARGPASGVAADAISLARRSAPCSPGELKRPREHDVPYKIGNAYEPQNKC